MSEDVFRFMTIRPPQRVSPENTTHPAVRAYGSAGDESPLQRDLGALRRSDGARIKMEDCAKAYTASSEFVSMLSQIALPHGSELRKLDAWILSMRQALNLADLKDQVSRIFGGDASELTASQSYRVARRRINDSLIAWTINPTDDKHAGPRLIRAARLCGLLEQIASGAPGPTARSGIDRTLRAAIVLPPDLFPLPKPEDKRRKTLLAAYGQERQRAETKSKQIVALMDQLKALRFAVEELGKAFETDLLDRRRASETAQPVSKTSPGGGSEPLASFSRLRRFFGPSTRGGSGSGAHAPSQALGPPSSLSEVRRKELALIRQNHATPASARPRFS